jgi:Uma2 family endonuclease
MSPPTTDRPEVDVPSKDRYTYADYRQLPEGAPYELVHGELVMSPAPELRHQRVARRFFRTLDNIVTKDVGGEVFFAPFDVRLSEETVLQPDLAFVSSAHADRLSTQAIEGAPDLVAEILSPATAHRDLTVKKRLYEMHGVREYWVIDPGQRTVEVFENIEGGFRQRTRAVEEGTAGSGILDAFEVDLSELFQ